MSPAEPGGDDWTRSLVGTGAVGLMLVEHLLRSLPFLQAPKHLRPTENRAMFAAAVPQGVIPHMPQVILLNKGSWVQTEPPPPPQKWFTTSWAPSRSLRCTDRLGFSHPLNERDRNPLSTTIQPA